MTGPLRIESLETVRGSFADGPHSFEVTTGEIVTLVGPNGCGKSTLLETVAGLLPARAGVVRVGDRVLTRGPAVEVPPHERGLGLLLQGLGLWPHRTVREQIALVAPLGRSAGSRSAGGRSPGGADRVERLAAELDLTSKLERKPDRLSGGEAQRAALLRALAADSPLLLLDEPTSAQFDASALRIEAVLRAEAAAGKQILIATHRAWEGVRSYVWPRDVKGTHV